MFTNHNSQFWDNRYSESDYAYGIPNQFLVEQQYRYYFSKVITVTSGGQFNLPGK